MMVKHCIMISSDSNASLPESANSIEVAALVKYYLASLPEPLTTFELYNEIKGARSSINAMRNILKRLPNVNYMTLEFITALLLHVSQKALVNKVGNLSPSHLSFSWILLITMDVPFLSRLAGLVFRSYISWS